MIKRIAFVALAALFTVTACNKAAGGLSPDGYVNQGTKVADKNSALTPYEQKQKLEETGKELISEVEVDKWKSTAEFIRALGEHLQEVAEDDDRAFDAFEEWSESIEDEMLYTKKRDSKLTMRVSYALSKLPKGTFKEDDGRFEFTEGGSDVKIITEVDGKAVTITLTNGAEGREYEVYSENWKAENDWQRRYYDGESYTEWDETVSIRIPAWVNVEVRDGAARRLNWRVNFNFTDTDGNTKVELEKDAAQVNTEFKFDDYTLSASSKYSSSNGTGYASESSAISRGSKVLVATGAETEVEIDGSIEDGYKGTQDKTVKVALDVLGKVQAKGTVDFAKMEYYGDKIDRYADEEQFAKAVRNLESCTDIAIYYDRKAGRQAWYGLEPFYNDTYGYWSYSPVIRFADDSSYGVDEFFNEKSFSSLMNALDRWMEDVSDYFSAFTD